MSDYNINLNIPLDWKGLEDRVANEAVYKVSQATMEHLEKIGRNRWDADSLIKAAIEHKPGLSYPDAYIVVSLIDYYVRKYIDEHVNEILDETIKDAVDKVLKRKIFKDKIKELTLEGETSE